LYKRREFLVYVAAPYTAPDKAGIQKNIEFAETVMIELLKRGFSVICPHKNTAHLDYVMPWMAFMEMSFRLIKACDAILFTGDWRNSKGCNMEWEFAKEHRIPVFTDIGELEEYQKALDEITVWESG